MNDFVPNASEFLDFASVPVVEEVKGDSDLSHLASTGGWKKLKEYIEGQINLLDFINIETGATVEQVGFKYIASRVAKTQLESIIYYVESNKD